MAYVRYVPPEELEPAERVDDPDHIIQIHALNPPVMREHLGLYRTLMRGPGPLTPRERELIAVRVSGLNGCRY